MSLGLGVEGSGVVGLLSEDALRGEECLGGDLFGFGGVAGEEEGADVFAEEGEEELLLLGAVGGVGDEVLAEVEGFAVAVEGGAGVADAGAAEGALEVADLLVGVADLGGEVGGRRGLPG